MFLSNELIQLVFADENDVFYGEDLTELELEQYLWLRLRRSKKYAAVYFLRALPEEESFSVRYFAGDRNCRPFSGDQKKGLKKWFSGKRENEAGKWMLDRLRDRTEPAALVCPLADFCAVASGESWKPLLQELGEDRKRSGALVLTAPPEAEGSRELLLHSPVFEWLQDTAILDARVKGQNLYGFLLRRKTPEASVFLNAVTEEGLEGLLRNAELSRSGPILTGEDRSAMAAWLSAYLRSPRLQREEPLFSHNLPGAYLRYRDLRVWLDQDKVWNALIRRSRSEELPRPGDSAPRICRSTEGKVGDCIERVFNMSPSLIADPGIAGLWDRVLGSLMTPGAAPADQRLAESMAKLTVFLSAADRKDGESCRRTLEVLQTLCRVLGEPELGEERLDRCLRLEESTDLYVKVRSQLRAQEEDLALQEGQTGPLAAARRAALEKQRAHTANMEDKCLRIIASLREHLNVSDAGADLGTLQGDLEKLLTEFRDSAREEPEIAAVPEEKFPAGTGTGSAASEKEIPQTPAGDDSWKYSSAVPKL